jgi:hypothetical protein
MNQTSTLQKRSWWRLLWMSTENDDLIVQVSPDIYKKLSVGIWRKKTKAETNMDKNLDKACERLSSQTPLSSFISRKV